jgi:hypothetical protein
MITPEFFWGFAIASIAVSIFWIVFGAVKYNEVWQDNKLLLFTAKKDREMITHLKASADPHAWLDSEDVAVNIAGRNKLYEKYEELVMPGTEVILIDSELEEDADEQEEGT